MTGHERPDIPLAVERLSVELVRDESEGNMVAIVEAAKDLEQRAAESSVARRIGGERRSEVGSGQIARGRAQGSEGQVGDGRRIAVPGQRQRRIRIGLADTRYRAP